ncbi:hypothetical protein GOV04_05755 [Candidatus Woesearchaeota archaeon]|nr:hypothetical protein [Candidatus Woesearchaeota archaeon]
MNQKNNKMLYVLKYWEISLKGANRREFERRLYNNIKEALKKNKVEHTLRQTRGRILLETTSDIGFLTKIAGVTSIEPTIKTIQDIEKIKSVAFESIKNINFETFKIKASRNDKTFSLTSPEIEKIVGAFIVEKTNKKVQIKKPDIEINIEVLQGSVHVSSKKIPGLGGLPLGIEGKTIVLIEDEQSLEAAKQVMKRGCSILPVAFKKIDISALEPFSAGQKLELQIVKDYQELEQLAKQKNIATITTNQKLETLKKLPVELSLLRPLVGL